MYCHIMDRWRKEESLSRSLPRYGAVRFVEDVLARRTHVFFDDDDAFDPAVFVNAQHRLTL